MAISETELILPSLYVISLSENQTISTSDLVSQLRNLLKPVGDDLTVLDGRNDDKFSQKVRNLTSHKTLEKLGFASINNGYHQITSEGLHYLNEDENAIYIQEKLLQDYEGNETNESIAIIETINVSTPLHIARDNFSIYELKRRFEQKRLILDPDFQRNDVWKRSQKAELVESVLMNIPLPFIYLTTTNLGEFVIVDGRQRLSALFEFIDNKFSLGKDLAILTQLKNKKFKDLEPYLQGIIEDCQFTVHIIKPPIPERTLINIFDRVNRGGTKLTNQEIRNALYQGKATILLNKLSDSILFKSATDNSIKQERMKDKYLILRFLSFYMWRKKLNNQGFSNSSDYKGDPDEFLANQMKYINRMKQSEVDSLESIFSRSMLNTSEIIGKNAFRLPNNSSNKIKRPINMALFEVISYLMASEIIELNRDRIKEEYIKLLEDSKFIGSFLSIDGSTKLRFEKIEEIINKYA